MRSGAPESLGLTLPFPPPIPRPHRTIDPHALKIPAAKRRNTRYPKTATLHFRLNQDKEQVLDALGNATVKLRAKLGESLSSIQKFDVPIEQATTSSLEAL